MQCQVQSVGHLWWPNVCQTLCRPPDAIGEPTGPVIGPPNVRCLLQHAGRPPPVPASQPPGRQMWPGDPKCNQNAAVQLSGRQIWSDGRLGRDDGRLGRDDGRLGRDDGRLGCDDGRIGRDDGRLGRDDGRLGRDDGCLGCDDGRLGRNDGHLGLDYGHLGRWWPPWPPMTATQADDSHPSRR